MTITDGMAVVQGFDLMKTTIDANPSAVGLWSFMTMSEKFDWMNDVIAVVTMQATDPMGMEFTITIQEWK